MWVRRVGDISTNRLLIMGSNDGYIALLVVDFNLEVEGMLGRKM